MPEICKDVLIVGGGAAGLFLALLCERKHISYALIDHQAALGMKWRLAGGAMGNMTNRTVNAEHYVSHTPKQAKKLLQSLFKTWQPQNVLDLLQEYGMEYEEREFGQIFCTKPVKYFIEKIIADLSEKNCFCGEKILSCQYSEKLPEHGGQAETVYTIKTADHVFCGQKLVIATGSSSYPQAGATDFALRLAKKWGHDTVPFRSALVPLLLPEHSPLLGLEGISIPVRLKIFRDGREIADPCGVRSLLFTHTGISGPAVLVMSCFWQKGDTLHIDFLPEDDLLARMHDVQNGRKLVKNLILPLLPDRLALSLIPVDLQNRKVAELSKKDRQRLTASLQDFCFVPKDTDGLKKAEACLGGVGLAQINQNLESLVHKNLYFMGECLDITGLLGGYNIHFALACAFRIAHRL